MKKRSKRYQGIKTNRKNQEMEVALESIKRNASAKFTETIEAHVNLNLDKKAGQTLRGNIVFPKSFGKKLVIWALVSSDNVKACKEAGASEVGGEEIVDKITKNKGTGFDVLITEPAFMKSVAKVAKIIGPKGLMPSPKNGTITPKPAEAITEFLAGKVSFKADDAGVLHQAIGKADFATKDLQANFQALLEEVEKAKPENHKGVLIESVYVTSTMGKALHVKA